MSKEDFFTRILLSYKSRLSSSVKPFLGLRDFCHYHHVAYRDFIHWASTGDIGCGIVEVDRFKQRLTKGKDVVVSGGSSPALINPVVAAKPLLFPLEIISDRSSDRCVESVSIASTPICRQTVLRDIRLSFPTGVKVSVREADVRDVYFLIHGY
jgi:hypothetical protein